MVAVIMCLSFAGPDNGVDIETPSGVAEPKSTDVISVRLKYTFKSKTNRRYKYYVDLTTNISLHFC
jgi:hypothetical protein